MRKWLLILLLAIPLIHAGLLRSPEPVDASGDVVLATGTATLANTKLSLANSYAFFDFSTDMTPWIGEEIEICPATAASKHYCVRGLVSTVGTGETTTELIAAGTGNRNLTFNVDAANKTAFNTAYTGTGGWFSTCDTTSVASGVLSIVGNTNDSVMVSGTFSGKLLYATVNISAKTGTWNIVDYTTTYVTLSPGLASGLNNRYFTASATNNGAIRYASGGSGATLSIDAASVNNSLLHILTPSSTGHWIKKSASSSTDGDAWSQKSASFLANDSAGYYYRIIQSKTPDVAIRKGTCTGTTQCRFSLVDGTAFIDGDGTVPVANYVGHTLKVRDSSGYEISGVIKAKGSGETSSELEPDKNFATACGGAVWTCGTGWSIAGGIATSVSGSNYQILDAVSNFTGKLIKQTAIFDTLTSGYFKLRLGNNVGAEITTSGTHSRYATGETTNAIYFIISSWGSGTISEFSNLHITAPSTTGATIVSATGGTTYNWTSKHASFNPNSASAYTWEILGQSIGTVTSADVHLATVDGGSMVEISGVDLSQYSGVDAYTPPTANLQLHLKADSGCYTDAGKTTACTNDGDKAYTWADQSGNGNDAVQATEGYRPLYKASIVGSLPAIRFDGSNDVLSNTGLATSGITTWSAYVVAKDSSAANAYRTMLAVGTATAPPIISIIQTTGVTLLNAYGIGSPALSTKPFGSTVHVVSGVTNSNSSVLGVDGFLTSAKSPAYNSTANGYTVGGTGLASAQNWLGDIYEILIYSTAHDDATRTRIERYLAGKWGITSYQPTYAGTSPARYMIALYDSAGKVATGWIGGPGAGETLGGEKFTDPTFDGACGGGSNWTCGTGWSVTGGKAVASSLAAGIQIYKGLAGTSGQLIKMVLTCDASTSGHYNLQINGLFGSDRSGTGDKSLYKTLQNSSGWGYGIMSSGDGFTGSFTDISAKQVTDISQSGVHLHSTPNAYDRKMARVDSGFDPNAVTSYKIFQVGNSGYELDSILQEDGQPIWGNEGINVYLQQEG